MLVRDIFVYLRLFKYYLALCNAPCLNFCDHYIESGRKEETFLLVAFYLVLVSGSLDIFLLFLFNGIDDVSAFFLS